MISVGYNAWSEKKEDWRSVARFMARRPEEAGGLVVFLPGYAELPFNYYFEDMAGLCIPRATREMKS
jgi:hypothetical protein